MPAPPATHTRGNETARGQLSATRGNQRAVSRERYNTPRLRRMPAPPASRTRVSETARGQVSATRGNQRAVSRERSRYALIMPLEYCFPLHRRFAADERGLDGFAVGVMLRELDAELSHASAGDDFAVQTMREFEVLE